MARSTIPAAWPGRPWSWRDGAVAMALVAAIGASLALGAWQWRRAADKAAQQAAYDRARAAPALALGGRTVPLAQWEGRRVVAQGVFENTRTIFLDNRTHRGVAGFYVLTPLRLLHPLETDNRVAPIHYLLVVRGWVPRDPRERTRLPVVVTPEAPVQIEGLAMAQWPQPRVLGAHTAPTEAGGRLLQHFEWDEAAKHLGVAVAPMWIRQSSALADGLVREWVEPGQRVARHHAYAVQWFGLAAVLAVYAAIALRRRWRNPDQTA